MVEGESRREHNPIHVSSDGAMEKAQQLAPLEEQSGSQGAVHGGFISVDTGKLNLPKDLTGKEEEKPRLLHLEPVTIIILIFALAFIALMAYLISIEPI